MEQRFSLKLVIRGLIGEVLGYENTQTFFEEFLLSILLHDSDFVEGRYRLEPFATGNRTRPWTNTGEDLGENADATQRENPFDLLVPIVTEESLSLQQYGYTVIRPKEGVYYPPQDAGAELHYVGFTVGK